MESRKHFVRTKTYVEDDAHKKKKKNKLMLKDKREKFDAVPTQKIARKYSVKVPKG